MPATLQPALITSQPFSECRNSYTFLFTLACSGFKVESRRSTSIVGTFRFGSHSISFVIAFVKYSLKYFFSIFFTDIFVIQLRDWSRWVIFLGTMTWTIFKLRALWWLYPLTELWMLLKVWVLSDHFVIQALPLLDKNTDQLRSLTGLSSHIRCSSVLDYSLNKIHWGIQQMKKSVQFFLCKSVEQAISFQWCHFIISAFSWNMLWSSQLS